MADIIANVPTSFLQRHKLDRVVPLLSREQKPEGYEPRLIALAAINNCIWTIRAAREAEVLAKSWRDYKVGAAVLAYNLEMPAMGVLVGANFKPQQGLGLNLHAEQVALAKARHAGLDRVMAIAVWGDPDDLDANPGQSPTLRPCRRCDDMFFEANEIRDETLIVSANQDLSKSEIYTAGELHKYYGEPHAVGPISEVPVYSLADDMDDDEYNNNIVLPFLVPKINELYPAR